MASPRVSILLPNLNNAKYLTERFETIVNQTYIDWELIVVDSYSDDGAWDIIQRYEKSDPRIFSLQAPREGIYAGLNRCIQEARGEFIYIATSDDTMKPECIEVMVDALDRHKNCSIAHCCLTVVDSEGKIVDPNPWELFPPYQFYGDKMKKSHIRYAPLDGVLYAFLYTVYTSVTQLMIRRTLFDRIGLFSCDYGSWADFGWGMKASLICNTIHIPQYLATWRVHPEQATALNILENPDLYIAFIKMIGNAVSSALPMVSAEERKFLDIKELSSFYRLKLNSLPRNSMISPNENWLRRYWDIPRISMRWKHALLHILFSHYSINLDGVGYAANYCKKHGLMNHIKILGN